MIRIYKTLIMLACVTSPMAFAINKLSVSDLLDRYAANQDQLISFIAKTEEVRRIQWSNEDRPDLTRMTTSARVDGKKTHIFYRVWGHLPTLDAPTHIDEARTWVDLWDGKRCILYYYRMSQDFKFAEISTDERRAKGNIIAWHAGTPFLGIRHSDPERRIDSVLRQADTISVRKELEQVGSVACYVIDAITISGTYTVWIDPQHGYQIARAEIHLGPNDRYRNIPLKDNEDDSLSVRNIRFENINGIWIPMEADISRTSIRQGSSRVRSTGHHKITQITLNPDHEALGSFIPVVENGTEVYDRDFGIPYTWQNGELIPNVDDYVIDQIREMAQDIKAEGQVPSGLAAKKTKAVPNDLIATANTQPKTQVDAINTRPEVVAESGSLPLVPVILIGLLIIGAIAWMVFRRLKA